MAAIDRVRRVGRDFLSGSDTGVNGHVAPRVTGKTRSKWLGTWSCERWAKMATIDRVRRVGRALLSGSDTGMNGRVTPRVTGKTRSSSG
jgi:ribosome modulation factor